jgi:hypothetical protein
MIQLFEHFLMNTQLHKLTQVAEAYTKHLNELTNAHHLGELMSCVVQLGALFFPTNSTTSTR